MAISDKDKLFIREQFAKAQEAKALLALDESEEAPELLYAVEEEEAICAVRVPMKQPHCFELWAVDRTSTPLQGVKVGTQNEYGQFHWSQLGNSPVEEG